MASKELHVSLLYSEPVVYMSVGLGWFEKFMSTYKPFGQPYVNWCMIIQCMIKMFMYKHTHEWRFEKKKEKKFLHHHWFYSIKPRQTKR